MSTEATQRHTQQSPTILPQNGQNSHTSSSNISNAAYPLSGRVTDVQGIFMLTSTLTIIMGLALGFFYRMPPVIFGCVVLGFINAGASGASRVQEKLKVNSPPFAVDNTDSAERIKTLEMEIQRLKTENLEINKRLTSAEEYKTRVSKTVDTRDATIISITKERAEDKVKHEAEVKKLQLEIDALKAKFNAIQDLEKKLEQITLEERVAKTIQAYNQLNANLTELAAAYDAKKLELDRVNNEITEKQQSK